MDNELLTVTMDSADDKAAWLSVAGEVDAASVARLQAALEDAQSRSAQVCLDMSSVAFIDSTGLAVLIAAARRGGLRIVQPSRQVRRLFEIAGIADMF